MVPPPLNAVERVTGSKWECALPKPSSPHSRLFPGMLMLLPLDTSAFPRPSSSDQQYTVPSVEPVHTTPPESVLPPALDGVTRMQSTWVWANKGDRLRYGGDPTRAPLSVLPPTLDGTTRMQPI
eukprot:362262-Chlamydomonas_euryale.AAC.2